MFLTSSTVLKGGFPDVSDLSAGLETFIVTFAPYKLLLVYIIFVHVFLIIYFFIKNCFESCNATHKTEINNNVAESVWREKATHCISSEKVNLRKCDVCFKRSHF